MLDSLQPDDFVEYCYTNILGRPSDPDGKRYYVNALLRGSSRLEVIHSFFTSDEYRKKFRNPFVTFSPPGHYYSPLPDIETIEQSYQKKVAPCRRIPGIDMNEEKQIELLKSFSNFYPLLPWGDGFKKDNTRYFFNGNKWYSYGDAIIHFAVINYFRPSRFIEIGSGYSSAVTLDTCELFLENKTKITFIEPYPQALFNILSEKDDPDTLLIRKEVQDISLSIFEELRNNDILFIDSSHVVKFSSDVLFIITEVLSRLNAGVLVHFHDIYWPFEYPLEWLKEGRAWNEAYVLQSFLANNELFEILFFNDFMGKRHRNLLEKLMPLCLKNYGCGLWIRKIK